MHYINTYLLSCCIIGMFTDFLWIICMGLIFFASLIFLSFILDYASRGARESGHRANTAGSSRGDSKCCSGRSITCPCCSDSWNRSSSIASAFVYTTSVRINCNSYSKLYLKNIILIHVGPSKLINLNIFLWSSSLLSHNLPLI